MRRIKYKREIKDKFIIELTLLDIVKQFNLKLSLPCQELLKEVTEFYRIRNSYYRHIDYKYLEKEYNNNLKEIRLYKPQMKNLTDILNGQNLIEFSGMLNLINFGKDLITSQNYYLTNK